MLVGGLLSPGYASSQGWHLTLSPLTWAAWSSFPGSRGALNSSIFLVGWRSFDVGEGGDVKGAYQTPVLRFLSTLNGIAHLALAEGCGVMWPFPGPELWGSGSSYGHFES